MWDIRFRYNNSKLTLELLLGWSLDHESIFIKVNTFIMTNQ